MDEKIMVEFTGEQMDEILRIQAKTNTKTVQDAIMYSVNYTKAMHTDCFNCPNWGGTDCTKNPYEDGAESDR